MAPRVIFYRKQHTVAQNTNSMNCWISSRPDLQSLYPARALLCLCTGLFERILKVPYWICPLNLPEKLAYAKDFERVDDPARADVLLLFERVFSAFGFLMCPSSSFLTPTCSQVARRFENCVVFTSWVQLFFCTGYRYISNFPDSFEHLNAANNSA